MIAKCWWRHAAAGVALLAMGSCGGGGGGGSPAGTGATPAAESAVVPTAYLGTFVGPCEAADEVVLAGSGNPLTTRSWLTVSQGAGDVAILTLRFDFHADASCGTSPVAYLSFDGAGNRAVFTGSQVVGDHVVQRVRISLDAATGTTPAANGRVEFGGAIRVSAPAAMAGPLALDDLWFVDGDTLYEGDLTVGPDGFPTGLDLGSGSQRVASVPAPIAACAARTVSWGPDNCSGSLQAAVSGASTLLADVTAPSVGSATFTCTAGNWASSNTTCAASVAPPPGPAGCAAQPLSWTVNGSTCQGTTDAVADGATGLVLNTSTSARGSAQYQCTGGSALVTSASCDPPLPPPPELTDPAQIAQAKNCIACHAVSDPAQSVNGVSFKVIADHYRGSPPAAGVLEGRVKAGSVGTFGSVPMPANPQISDAELAIVIPWILGQ